MPAKSPTPEQTEQLQAVAQAAPPQPIRYAIEGSLEWEQARAAAYQEAVVLAKQLKMDEAPNGGVFSNGSDGYINYNGEPCDENGVPLE